LRVTFAGICLFTVTSIIMNILLHAHSGLRYVVLGLLIAAIFTAYSNWQKRSQGDSKLYLFTLIATHTQLLIGLVLYFMSPKVNFDLISEKVFRFYSIEHVFMMLIAIVLITVGRVRSKKLAGADKHRTVLYFYGLALVIILVAIPWPFRNLGSGWF
jgi:cytochrome c oxidase assembly factor CtaG